MAKHIRVAVSGNGGDVARGVVACLEESNLGISLVVTGSQHEIPHLMSRMADVQLPNVSDKGYLEALTGFLSSISPAYYFPCVNAEIELVARHCSQIEALTGAKVFSNGHSLVSIFLDKFETARYLSSYEISVPDTFLSEQVREHFLGHESVILKPRYGWGSRSVRRIRAEQVSECLDRIIPNSEPSVVQCDYSHFGAEFTAGVYISPKQSIKRACVLEREIRDGRTWTVRRRDSKKMEEKLIEFASSVGALYLNFQGFINSEGDFVVFEVNPRLSGSVYFQSPVLNVPTAWLLESLGQSYRIPDDPGAYSGYRKLSEHLVFGEQ